MPNRKTQNAGGGKRSGYGQNSRGRSVFSWHRGDPRIPSWQDGGPEVPSWQDGGPGVPSWQDGGPGVPSWQDGGPGVSSMQGRGPRISSWQGGGPGVSSWQGGGPGVSSWQGGRPGISSLQGGGPRAMLPNLLPLREGSTETTMALVNNLVTNLLQSGQNPAPSLMDMPMPKRRNVVPGRVRFDFGYGPNVMPSHRTFRRMGRANDRFNINRQQQTTTNKQNSLMPNAKDAESHKPLKSKSTEESNETPKVAASGTETKKRAYKSIYKDIAQHYLRCHICNKSMWDGRSFENHLSGRTHAIMMQKTAESYASTADNIRQKFKVHDVKKTDESSKQTPKDFCALCDTCFTDEDAHRISVGHRKLRKFLHPTCSACNMEMSTRLEFDEHRLTPEHMRNIQKKRVIKKDKLDVIISTLSIEKSNVHDSSSLNSLKGRRLRKGQAQEKKRTRKAMKEQCSVSTIKDKEDAEGETDEEYEERSDNEEGEDAKNKDKGKQILDYQDGDDLTYFTNARLPSYNTGRGVGRSFLSPYTCVQCRLCNKCLDSEETAEVHLRTWRHHQLFARMLREKMGVDGHQDVKKHSSLNNSEESDNSKRRNATPDQEYDGENDHEQDEADGDDVEMTNVEAVKED